ncbi:Na-translocating system protein MpsC family protein [Metabacillus litoralis]|uniref:Na-translocating system protein MpsC family protein n=1 Tax=Metabacillus litoralis TaxID=152268 RepID=UPI001CFD4347|nr:Na-translocating system protein MpsC family protein [Metabacillus litoralis]
MKKIDSYYQEDLLLLSSSFSKMLKKKFGKGPEACFITYHSNKLLVHIRNFVTPAEDVLVKSDQLKLAYSFRTSVMEIVFKEFLEEASELLGISFDSYYEDWNYEDNSGLILFENTSSLMWEETKLNPIWKDEIFDQVIQICSEIHKVPNTLEIVKIKPTLYVIECQRILLKVEKILFQKGQLNIIHERSFEIRKCYMEQRETLQHIFGSKIDHLYLMWDYKKDRSLLFVHLA